MTNLMKDNPICPYIKNIPGFFKKVVKFVKNFPIFLKDIKVFLTHTVAQACTYICVSPHVYMHRATRTYA
jgi:hypothetical protein